MFRLPADLRTMLRALAAACLLLVISLSVLPCLCKEEAVLEAAALPCTYADEMSVRLLGSVLAAEAGEESYLTQVGFAAMLCNRVVDPRFPGELGGVIADAGLRQIAGEPPERARRAARAALLGTDPTAGALYCAPAATTDPALFGDRVTAVLGAWIFVK